jgi:hypothetical protein
MQMKAARAGRRIWEVPVDYRRRAGGQSKIAGTVFGSIKAAARILFTLARIAVQRQQRLPSTIANLLRTKHQKVIDVIRFHEVVGVDQNKSGASCFLNHYLFIDTVIVTSPLMYYGLV